MNAQAPSSGSDFPRMIRVRQRFPASAALEVPAAVANAVRPLLKTVRPGQTVAVAVGSRGITHLAGIVRATLEGIRAAGGVPFIVPAMGSHGGATAEGQEELLAGYGVTAAAMGVEIRSSMAVRAMGTTATGTELLWSEAALGANHVLLVNRIKPHTDFSGGLGSGLQKMLVVGLGKHDGAAGFHRQASRLGHERVLRESARGLMGQVPLLGGVAIIEDQRHQTARIEGVPATGLAEREEALCAEARAVMPRLPFAELDLLIVDRMGKNISGAGMDPAVIGRSIHGYSLAEDAPQAAPHVRRLFVRDLTPESHGNAVGVGMADFTTARLVGVMDRHVTVTNSLTALSLQAAKVPMYFESDREAVRAALGTLVFGNLRELRVARIQDTLSVEVLSISEGLWDEWAQSPELVAVGAPDEMRFDAAGTLAD